MPYAKLPKDFPEFKLPPKRFFEDERWICQHLDELTQKYPDQWIAVYQKEVVAADKSLAKVQRIGRQKADEGQCVYSFIEGGIRYYRYRVVLQDPR